MKSKNEEEDLEQNQSENVFETADDMDDDSNAVHEHSQIATRKKCRSTRKFCQQNSRLPSNVTIDQGQMVIDISNNNNISKEDQTTNASSKENRRSYKLTRPKISLSRFRRGMKSLNDGPYSQNTKIKGGTMKLKDFVNQSAQYNSGRQGNHSSILIPGIPFIGKESTINSQTNQQINDIQSEEKNCNESSNANMTNMNSNTLGSEGQVFDIESRQSFESGSSPEPRAANELLDKQPNQKNKGSSNGSHAKLPLPIYPVKAIQNTAVDLCKNGGS